MQESELLDYKSLSKMFSRSISTLRLWRAAGEIPPGRKIGRRRLWARAEILAWLRAGRPSSGTWKRIWMQR